MPKIAVLLESGGKQAELGIHRQQILVVADPERLVANHGTHAEIQPGRLRPSFPLVQRRLIIDARIRETTVERDRRVKQIDHAIFVLNRSGIGNLRVAQNGIDRALLGMNNHPGGLPAASGLAAAQDLVVPSRLRAALEPEQKDRSAFQRQNRGTVLHFHGLVEEFGFDAGDLRAGHGGGQKSDEKEKNCHCPPGGFQNSYRKDSRCPNENAHLMFLFHAMKILELV